MLAIETNTDPMYYRGRENLLNETTIDEEYYANKLRPDFQIRGHRMIHKRISWVLFLVYLLLPAFAFAGTTTHVYDEINRRIETHYPDGTVVYFSYDRAGVDFHFL